MEQNEPIQPVVQHLRRELIRRRRRRRRSLSHLDTDWSRSVCSQHFGSARYSTSCTNSLYLPLRLVPLAIGCSHTHHKCCANGRPSDSGSDEEISLTPLVPLYYTYVHKTSSILSSVIGGRQNPSHQQGCHYITTSHHTLLSRFGADQLVSHLRPPEDTTIILYKIACLLRYLANKCHELVSYNHIN